MQVHYELEVMVDAPWTGLSALSAICAGAGLVPVALRLNDGGVIACKLQEGPGTDLAVLEEGLATSPGLLMLRFTTLIDCG